MIDKNIKCDINSIVYNYDFFHVPKMFVQATRVRSLI